MKVNGARFRHSVLPVQVAASIPRTVCAWLNRPYHFKNNHKLNHCRPKKPWILKWLLNNATNLRRLGAERFGTMTRVYYREAVGAIVVYDVTKDATFTAVNKWKTDLDTKVNITVDSDDVYSRTI